MDEFSALEVTAMRAVETRDRARLLWTDADRSWASRAAAEVVGEHADTPTFIARRARLTLERIGETHPSLPRAVRALRWRPWVGWSIVVGALILGVAVDRIGGAQRVNLLAPPVFALLAWNLGVYVALAVGYVVRYGGARPPGPLRALVTRLAGRGGRRDRGRPAAAPDREATITSCTAALTADWSRLAAPLYAARSARILHWAAAALAMGVIAGLYLRGLAFEYRASWESTFLDAAQVRALLAVALAPGSWLTGLAVPGVAEIEAIRTPAGESAARWLHLLAASILAIVVVPRLVLAAGAGLVERYRAGRLPLPLAEPYFQRLLRGFRGGPVRLRVLPYSYATPPAALAGLEAIAARVFGGSAALTVEAPVAYGDEDTFARRGGLDGQGPVIALFNLTATPEEEAHGAFLSVLTARRDPAQPLLVFVDQSAFRARWPDDAARLRERRVLWDDFLAARRVTAIHVDLGAPDLPAADAAIDAALAGPEPERDAP
ncbi:MAG: DUF2868 domain-containing protein [Betaproteobacteria bacterium]|nr:DUF2868 domain-containing protein [Betaproteobacteria bacterium]